MNEWSPGCGLNRLVAPNQRNQMRSLRSPWDEENVDRVNSNKSVVLNYRTVTDPRNKSSFQQRSQENMSKTSLSGVNRIKKYSIGSSDPRFKRVISTGIHNNACVGTELKKSECSSPTITEEQDCLAAEDWNSTDRKKPHCGKIAAEDAAEHMKNEAFDRSPECSSAADPGFGTNRSFLEHFKEAEKFSFTHDLIPNSFPKQSLSDCTIDTRNASLVSGELGDGLADKLHTFSSTTRVKKVQNWIAERKPKLDRRQSVITVIGQTQGASSSAFQEIDQRRKLVKELDKYAICNKITDSDKDREINTLVAQIKFPSPSRKILCSNHKNYNIKELSCKTDLFTSKCQETEKISKKLESNIGDEFSRDNDLNVENDFSSSPSSRRSCVVNKKKSFIIWENEYDIRAKFRYFLQNIPYYWLAHLVIVLSGILCWYTYFALQRNGIFLFGFIPRKPKPATWYEKIYSWLWEFVRPPSVSDS